MSEKTTPTTTTTPAPDPEQAVLTASAEGIAGETVAEDEGDEDAEDDGEAV